MGLEGLGSSGKLKGTFPRILAPVSVRGDELWPNTLLRGTFSPVYSISGDTPQLWFHMCFIGAVAVLCGFQLCLYLPIGFLFSFLRAGSYQVAHQQLRLGNQAQSSHREQATARAPRSVLLAPGEPRRSWVSGPTHPQDLGVYSFLCKDIKT